MAKRPTLTDLTSLTNSSAINTLSQNWDAIQEAFDNTLSLDGSTPNAMEADFDLNGNALLNVGTIDVTNLTLDGQTVTDLATVPEWRSSWLTATSYAKNDLVKTAGNVYICLIGHTSGTFATDLTDLKWELMVSKGDSGAGTGDLVSTNNLSDLTDAATARSNLSLGTVATENTVPVAKGGTGATTASDARTALGAQAQDTFLDNIAALTDPNADRLLFWDDSAGAMAFLTPSTGLAISGTSITVTDLDLFFRLNSAHAGANATGAQNPLPQNVTLDASSVYEYEIFYRLLKTAGSTSHTVSILWGGTATINNWQRHMLTTSVVGIDFTNVIGSFGADDSQTTPINASGTLASANTRIVVREHGTFSVNVSGTVIPQYQLSAAPGGAYSTAIGSFFRLRKLGASGSNLSQGSWA